MIYEYDDVGFIVFDVVAKDFACIADFATLPNEFKRGNGGLGEFASIGAWRPTGPHWPTTSSIGTRSWTPIASWTIARIFEFASVTTSTPMTYSTIAYMSRPEASTKRIR